MNGNSSRTRWERHQHKFPHEDHEWFRFASRGLDADHEYKRRYKRLKSVADAAPSSADFRVVLGELLKNDEFNYRANLGIASAFANPGDGYRFLLRAAVAKADSIDELIDIIQPEHHIMKLNNDVGGLRFRPEFEPLILMSPSLEPKSIRELWNAGTRLSPAKRWEFYKRYDGMTLDAREVRILTAAMDLDDLVIEIVHQHRSWISQNVIDAIRIRPDIDPLVVSNVMRKISNGIAAGTTTEFMAPQITIAELEHATDSLSRYH